jgi:hypothetical protein
LLGVFFDPEYGDDIFLRKVPWLSAAYKTLHHRRHEFFIYSASHYSES